MHRRNGRGRVLPFGLALLSVLIITLDFRGGTDDLVQRVKDGAAAAVAPIQKALTTAGRPVSDLVGALGDLNDARARAQRLERRIRAVEATNVRARALIEENRRLRELLGLERAWFRMRMVAARVIGEDPSNYRWSVVIDRGRADGILPDMAVVDGSGLVGKVIAAGPHVASILLLVDPEAGAGAVISGARDRGAVRGNGAGRPLTLDFIGGGARVAVGDEVVTSGYDFGIFPPGIPIGEVVHVRSEGGGLERVAEVEPVVDPGTLDFVAVILDSGRIRATARSPKGRSG